MSDKNHLFVPEKIKIHEIKLVKGQLDDPENFEISHIKGYHLENSLECGFNLDEKLIKADYILKIKTDSKGKNEQEAEGNFHFVFIYFVENLTELAKVNERNLIELDSGLANALSSVTYSTSRGILYTSVQGTALQNFVLPIINPNKLLPG